MVGMEDLEGLPEAEMFCPPDCITEGETIPELNHLKKFYTPERGGVEENTF